MEFTFKYRNHAEALYRALTDDAFYIAMENAVLKEESSKEAMLRYMDYSMREADLYGCLYIPPGRDYGTSVWSRPLTALLECSFSGNSRMKPWSWKSSLKMNWLTGTPS